MSAHIWQHDDASGVVVLYLAPEVGTSDFETSPYCVLLLPPAADTIAEGLHRASRIIVAQASAPGVMAAVSDATT